MPCAARRPDAGYELGATAPTNGGGCGSDDLHIIHNKRIEQVASVHIQRHVRYERAVLQLNQPFDGHDAAKIVVLVLKPG